MDISAAVRAQRGHRQRTAAGLIGELVGFNTYCASAFDRLDLSGLRAPRPACMSPSGVMTTVVFAEGRLMQRRSVFRSLLPMSFQPRLAPVQSLCNRRTAPRLH